ncbi:DUF4184 family protein [Chitinophaga arvensicola]|uniref:DUF4184 family protein n=1 Tax=Chitinophaga arvensicola TaxID=29529 RepID=A0A1I0QEV7_9BACT|nr:DUF4184 family protein [Chitinophaga arvensicola]SEW25369.1 protein of unknown function [Chitinophaga arvensicola]
MPFTISHAAIVVPFTNTSRQYLSATGLIIGSMVPDFYYFILLNPYFNSGHQWWGIFVYDIPLALLLAWLYHQVVKPMLLPYLPAWAGTRLQLFRTFNWNSYFRQHYWVVLSSIILGVLTHFFLDAFTHGEGGFVTHLAFLQKDIIVVQHPMKMWYLMQYLSSVAGLLILLYFFLKIPRVNSLPKKSTAQQAFFWTMVTVISGVVLIVNEYVHHIPCKGMDYLAVALGGVFYGLLFTVGWYRYYSSRSER